MVLLPARLCDSAGNSDRNVSVTSGYCVKTNKPSVMISSLPGSPKILVFSCQISSRHSKEFPPSGGLKQGRGGQNQQFLSLSVNISKTVADAAIVTINKKAQLTLTNPRDSKACKNCSNSTCFVSFHRIPFPQISNYQCIASHSMFRL